MKILTQNLKTGKTTILNVPSPSNSTNRIKVLNEYSLISTGTESYVVNFGKAGWINKARQQPDRVKDVINKIKSSGLSDTYRAIKTKIDYPMVMGYSAVGTVSLDNKKYNLVKGTRVFTNSCHQEEGLVDYNMCVKIPDEVDFKSASFGAIGGIALQSIKCIPKSSSTIALIGLGLLGQVTSRILVSLGYECIAFDINSSKVKLAEKYGAVGVHKNNITEEIQNHTNGKGVDCTIIAASSLSSRIVNDATSYTKRKGKIISSGLVGLDLIRDKFFQKQIEIVVSNSSGDKNHTGQGSSHKNISHFFKLLAEKKVDVVDLISQETSLNDSDNIYSFPNKSLFFSKIIKYDTSTVNNNQTISCIKNRSGKPKVGLIGSGNFALSTLIPTIKKTNEGYLHSILGREGLPLFVAKKRFNVHKITTNESDFYEDVDIVCIATPHETHYNFLKKSIELSLSTWIEKPLAISIKELISIKKEMLSKKLIYSVGFNRSSAPWTNFMISKINSKKTDISMQINAGVLPQDHWLLDQNTCGGRILGECCHFIDLALTLLSHTNLTQVECVNRDRYYQDTGNYILYFQDGSKVDINYRHDLSASVPKEKIIVKTSESKHINNNWKKFSSGKILCLYNIKKGKGHNESFTDFLNNVNNNRFSTESEINNMCFSTYVSIKLQEMSKGDILDIFDSYKNEILSKHSLNKW